MYSFTPAINNLNLKKLRKKGFFISGFIFHFFLFILFTTIASKVDAQRQVNQVHSYYVDTVKVKNKGGSIKPNIILPGEECLLFGQYTVLAGSLYTYTLNCSDGSYADYWEISCGTTDDYSDEYIVIKWNESGCTGGTIKAKQYGGATLASKSVIITQPPPPPPPSISYTPLFTSSNFTKTIDLSKLVGAIPAAANVNSGAVSYTIPIFVAPGTNGVQPSVSISYNSRAGAGIVGYGWNISGLSVISRSGKNIYNDGVVQPVKYTDEDGFVLDGMRLYPITGANGADGTIYAGESETFAKIISNTTSSANNPDWFKVTTKDGTVLEYGNTADSRIKTDNGVNVMFWRLNRTIDINGNYIDYVYDNTGRDSRVKTIKYTGNINTSLAPFNSINFNYALKTDQNTLYDGGGSLASKHLLTDIKILANGSTVKTYLFNYGFDNINSFLKEITEKGKDGTALNSTIFLYGDQPQNLVVTPTTALSGSLDFFAGEYDMDGKTDLLAAEKYYSETTKGFLYTKYSLLQAINTSSSTLMYQKNLPQNSSVEEVNEAKLFNFLASDFDGDGRDDVLEINSDIEELNCGKYRRRISNIVINYTKSFNNQTGFTEYIANNYSYPVEYSLPYKYVSEKGNFILPGDFDGDGNQDYILVLGKKRSDGQCNYNTFKYAFDYKAFFTSPATNRRNSIVTNFEIGPNSYGEFYAQTIADADLITAIDIDGDGKTELLITKDQLTYILAINRIGDMYSGYSFAATTLFTTSAITKDSRYYPGDFNGDRKTDLLVRSANGSWNILYSAGNSFKSEPITFNQTPNINNDRIAIGDFNGDGRSDIIHGYPYFVNGVASTSKLSLYFSRGSSFYYEQYDYNNLIGYDGFIVGDFNGDGRSDLLNRINIFGDADFISIKSFGKENLLSKVTDGHNVTTTFDYKLLTDKTTYPYFYNRTVSLDDPANKNPYNYVQLPMNVAFSISQPDGIGGVNATEFNYEDAVVHRSGKGFLGFKKITAKNNVAGITSATENDINTTFAVLFTTNQKTILTATAELLNETRVTNSFVSPVWPQYNRFFQKIDKVLNIDYANGTASESTNTYDDFGNVTINVVKTGTLSGSTVNAVETTTATTTFGIHNTPVKAKPDAITVSNQRAGMPAIGKTTEFSYKANGLVASQSEFVGLPKSVTTTYEYSGVGNNTKITVSAPGLNSRVTNVNYDPKGIFPITKENTGAGLSQAESATYDYSFGTPISQTSSDCLTTTFEYDAFGRLKKTNFPEGYSVNTSLKWDVNGESVFYEYTEYPGGNADTKVYRDKLGRAFKTQTLGFNDQWLTQLNTYDAKGNVLTSTNTHFSSETPVITTNNYDSYNRLTSVSNALNTITSAYTKLSGGKMQMETQDATGQSTTKISDATGKIITAIDKGGQLDYTYDSRGNQTQVKHGANVLITNTYDSYGRQTTVVDKNAGTVAYDYDAFGQLTQQTDNNGNAYTMYYDDFGRITSRQGSEGVTTYEYYKEGSCSNNSISKVTGFNGEVKEFTFDNFKRPLTEKITVDGIPYLTQYSYDTYSQLTKITYPSGVVVNNNYDGNGDLLSVTGGDVSAPITLFTGTKMDGFGHYTEYNLGNGKSSVNTYTNGLPTRYYTPLIQDLKNTFNYANGNLLSRQDAIRSITENFEYDDLNRLTKSTVNGVVQLNISYDGSGSFSMGNIAAKTDAGNYVYQTNKLHAVAYITNPTGAQTPPTTIATTEQNINYTPFLKTASITEGAYQVDYTYGADYQRVKSILQQNSTIIETKYYFGNYEKQIRGGVTREVHYVSGGNGLCAMIVRQAGVNSFYFVYTDQLGSILTITDINGTKVAEQNFDAWGRNRNPANWQYTNVPVNPDWLYRGYTGHEHVAQFALINMNGRIYDPVEGRMLSPDNFVSDPFSSQAYNRYSYALNNPLSYVDPDGNLVWFAPIIIGAIIGGFSGGIHADMQGKSFLGGFVKGVFVGGVGGALALVGGGTFIANVAWGAGQGVFTCGLSNVLNGQNFFSNAGSAALWGGAFAALSSGIESLKNYKDGYGFGTNEGRLREFISDYTSSLGTSYEKLNADNAMGFVKERYGLKGARFIYDQSGAVTLGNYGVTPPNVSSDIFIDRIAFKNPSILKATLVHEYGHLMLDKIIQNGQFIGWTYNNYSNSLNNSTLFVDGPLGYAQEIYNSGNLHLSPSFLKSAANNNPLYSIWNSSKYGSKLFYSLPRRFSSNVTLKFY